MTASRVRECKAHGPDPGTVAERGGRTQARKTNQGMDAPLYDTAEEGERGGGNSPRLIFISASSFLRGAIASGCA